MTSPSMSSMPTAPADGEVEVETNDAEGRRAWVILAVVLTLASMLWYWRYAGRTGFFDWTKERFYFDELRESLRESQLPPIWFDVITPQMRRSWPALDATYSYYANPETLFLSPFLPLAALPLEWFWSLYVAGSLVLAIVGVISLTRALGWSPWTGGLLYGLLFLNPWLVQHLAIGYTPWITVCWLPLVASMVVRRRPVWAGLALAAVVWAGGMHVFTWAVMAIAVVLCGVAIGRRWSAVRHLGVVVAAAFGFALPRLIAIVASAGELTDREPQASYSGLDDLARITTDTTLDPYVVSTDAGGLGANLYDGLFYVGWWYLAIAAVVVLVGWRRSPVRLCIGAMVVFTVLGWGTVWRRAASVVPSLGAEVYPWRFLPIGYVFSVVAVAVVAEQHVRRGRWWIGLVVVPVLWGFYARTGFFIDVVIDAERTAQP